MNYAYFESAFNWLVNGGFVAAMFYFLYKRHKKSLKKTLKAVNPFNTITGSGNMGNQWKGENLTLNNYHGPSVEMSEREKSQSETIQLLFTQLANKDKQLKRKFNQIERLNDQLEKAHQENDGLWNELITLKYEQRLPLYSLPLREGQKQTV